MLLTSCEGTLDDVFGEWDKPSANTNTTPADDSAIEYVEYTVSGTTVTPTTKTVSDFTEITGAITELTADKPYVVKGTVSFTGNVAISGDAKIIICDGASLTINGALVDAVIPASNSLSVYGKTVDSGSLTINLDDGTNGVNVKDLNIHGAKFILNFGASSIGINGSGDINVYDGTLKSLCTANNSQAIELVGDMNVYGGTVNAEGIQNGFIAYPGKLVVNGGNVVAKGGTMTSGVPGMGVSCPVEVKGGTLTVTGGDGTGIWDGGNAIDGDVQVDGGSLIASGGSGANDGLGVAGTINFTVTTALGTNDNTSWPGTTNLTSGHKYNGSNLPTDPKYRYIKIQ